MAVTHFKDGKTMMLVGCAATLSDSQSCTNRPDVGLRRAMTSEVGRLFVIGRQSVDHRTSAGRCQRTSPDDLPTIIGDIGRFHSWLVGAPVGSPSTDARPMFTMFGRASPDNLSMVLRLKESGER